MLEYDNTKKLYDLLTQYEQGKIDLFELLDESNRYFDGIRGVCAWLTSNGQKPFDGYDFDDLVDYYRYSI